jgi:hypothetical protein
VTLLYYFSLFISFIFAAIIQMGPPSEVLNFVQHAVDEAKFVEG